MSFEALAEASKKVAGSSKNKLILLLLANYADQQFTCFPSIKRLAMMAECCESTVRRSLKDLEKRGLIEIKPRYEPYGDRCRQTSNIYTLRGFQNETHPPVKLTPAPLSKSTGDITSHINQSIYTIPFEEFWSVYTQTKFI